ncbi:MAG: RNA methyltransferase [Candidatus Diapherotrites archaeon]
MNLRIVLSEPEYSGNIGFTARAMKNFGANELALVNPKAEHLNGEAKSRAMNAKEILLNAEKHKSISLAVKGTDIAVAFTARLSKRKGLKRTTQSLQEFAEQYADSDSKISLVFGNEKNGLTNEQLDECDFFVTIPTSREYRAMNLSHSVAVVLYALNSAKTKRKRVKQINENLKKLLIHEFNELIYAGKKIRQKQKTLNAFKALISRSPASEAEAKAILSVLESANNAVKRKIN